MSEISPSRPMRLYFAGLCVVTLLAFAADRVRRDACQDLGRSVQALYAENEVQQREYLDLFRRMHEACLPSEIEDKVSEHLRTALASIHSNHAFLREYGEFGSIIPVTKTPEVGLRLPAVRIDARDAKRHIGAAETLLEGYVGCHQTV